MNNQEYEKIIKVLLERIAHLESRPPHSEVSKLKIFIECFNDLMVEGSGVLTETLINCLQARGFTEKEISVYMSRAIINGIICNPRPGILDKKELNISRNGQ